MCVSFLRLAPDMEAGNLVQAWVENTLIMFVCVGVATLLVMAWPAGGGSGIPEVLAFLNGQRVTKVTFVFFSLSLLLLPHWELSDLWRSRWTSGR